MSEATVDVADLRRAGSSDAADRADDAPLRDDIRLLGRVLGEVIGEQAGPDVLDMVESTRVEAFKIRRSEVDRAELAERLAGLDIRSANHVIRAFSHFSLLANLAEDIHHERRRRFHRREGSPPQKGSLAATFQLLDEADLRPTSSRASSPGRSSAPSSPRTRPRCAARRSPTSSGRSASSSGSATARRWERSTTPSGRPSSGGRCSPSGRPRCSGCRGCG